MKTFFGLLLIILVAGYVFFINSKTFDTSFMFHDADMQEAVINVLKEEDIAHQAQPDGTVSYFSKDEKRVNEIKMDVLHRMFKPNIQYHDKALEQRFLQTLDAEKISYEIKEKNGERRVYWATEDDERVDKIQKRLSWDFSIRFYDSEKEREQQFLRMLEEEKIDYDTVITDARKLITWSKKDNAKVESILQKLPRECCSTN